MGDLETTCKNGPSSGGVCALMNPLLRGASGQIELFRVQRQTSAIFATLHNSGIFIDLVVPLTSQMQCFQLVMLV